ncbi:hypothetical protein ES706_05661 [subsurface metagenome]
MTNSFLRFFEKIKNKTIGRFFKKSGIKGKIIKIKNNKILFYRGERYFNVKKEKDRAIYEDYNEWKLIQTWKGRKGAFLDLWEKTKEKQLSNWKFIGVSKYDKMLEVGFRDGYNLKYLEGMGVNIEGIDVNSVAVKAAKTLGCKVFEEDIQKKTHYNDKSFDVISACDVLEHCFSPENALKEMNRILKDDGRILIEIPLENKFGENLLHGHSALFYNEHIFESLVNSYGFYINKKDITLPERNRFGLKKINKNK